MYWHSSAENGEIKLNGGKLCSRTMTTNKQAQQRCQKGDENLFNRVYQHSSAENGEIRLNGGKLRHRALALKKMQ